jgi:hypothetical protein
MTFTKPASAHELNCKWRMQPVQDADRHELVQQA